MSENEIKPVLTIDVNTLEMAKVESLRADRVATRPYSKLRVDMGEVALYDQSAIDRLTAERDDWRRQAWHETDVAEAAAQEIERLRAERDAAVAALDRIVSLKMSMFKDPCDMLGECVNIAARAIDAARSEGE